jgi:hypothetical protein
MGIEKRVEDTMAEKFRVGRVTQAVEHLPSKHESLSSNPRTEKKEESPEKFYVLLVFPKNPCICGTWGRSRGGYVSMGLFHKILYPEGPSS